MNIIKKYFLILLTIIINLYNSHVYTTPIEPISIKIAGDYWCPYNCFANSQNPGFLVELITSALKIYNIDVTYTMMPWHEALDQIDQNKIDAVIGVTKISGRNLISSEKPIEYSSFSSFTRNDTKWTYDGSKSLRGKKLGIITEHIRDESVNYYVGNYYLTNPQMFELEDGLMASAKMIKNLIDTKIDVYMDDERVVNHYIKQHNLQDILRNAGKSQKINLPIYIAFSDKSDISKKYLEYFEKGLEILKINGDYTYLRKKYNMDYDEYQSP